MSGAKYVESLEAHRRFQRYPAYEDSGVEWLGEIPAHWTAKRLKFLAAEPIKNGIGEAGAYDDPEWPRYVRITDIAGPRELRKETFKSLPPELAREATFKRGDLLFAAVGATYGKSYLHVQDCGPVCFAGYMVRFSPGCEVSPSFAAYWTESSAYWALVQSRVVQATIQNFSAAKYKELTIPLPPLSEQRAIAAFLDRETGRVDALMAEKQRLIELLHEKRTALIAHVVTKGLDPTVPMRDPSVEWVREIPAHWEVRPLKRVFTNLDSRRVPLSSEQRATMTKEYPYYGASGVIDLVEGYLFDEPLILVAEDGANLYSRSTPLAFVATGKYWVNNHAHILKPFDGDVEYWAHVLGSVVFDPWISGSAQPKLTSDNLGSIPLPVPPDSERAAILQVVRHHVAKLDHLVGKVREANERLREIRTALISAAVTGKIDVRAEAA